MDISICKFHLRGWLCNEPQVTHPMDKDRVSYSSAVVKLAVPRVTYGKNGICMLGGYHIISIAVRGVAAEKIEEDGRDADLRWRRRDLVEITGYLVPAMRKTPKGKDELGRPLTPSYRLRTNNVQNIINYSAYERRRKRLKENASGSSSLQFTTIAPGRREPGEIPLAKALEMDYHDF